MCTNLEELTKAVGALNYEDFRTVTKNAKRIVEIGAKVNFKSGDRVSFTTRGGEKLQGTVIKPMVRNIAVRTDDGMSWRVNPGLLRK